MVDWVAGLREFKAEGGMEPGLGRFPKPVLLEPCVAGFGGDLLLPKSKPTFAVNMAATVKPTINRGHMIVSPFQEQEDLQLSFLLQLYQHGIWEPGLASSAITLPPRGRQPIFLLEWYRMGKRYWRLRFRLIRICHEELCFLSFFAAKTGSRMTPPFRFQRRNALTIGDEDQTGIAALTSFMRAG